MGIKLKLIGLFIVMKVLPLILIAYIAVTGATKLNDYFSSNTKNLFNENKKILQTTANNAVNDSIKALDKKSQQSLEKLSVSVASQVANFLYERDRDILFLSRVSLKKDGQKIFNSFYHTKQKAITVHEDYIYDEKKKQWISSNLPKETKTRTLKTAKLEDNKKEFHFVDPIKLKTKNLPIYKEVTFFNLKGKEIYKKSSIESMKMDISKKENTYCKAEDYFSKIQNLREGEIYVSNVIGAYVGSKVIGTFSKEKAKKMKVDFKPELHGYAGVENPKGKQFEGIIRFVTPLYRNFKKVGYLSLALDHRHIMEFTDSFDPVNPHLKQNIANAGAGNYAFMWDNKARSISHPRDYFIVGYDPKTGKRVTPWMSKKVAEDFKASGKKDIISFLDSYPTFKNQSLKQKPNIPQLLKDGNIALDCRYLNFAPQCQGWMQLTQNGGYGSFVIFWSKVWKLSTAATIPYYTGQYGDSKRGFGFVTIGANVDEFHKVANKTKENIDTIIKAQSSKMEQSLAENDTKISSYISTMINQLGMVTILMIIIVIFIAIWMSDYITKKIQHLVDGTRMFADNNLEYQIEITSKDEIGELEHSLNNMANKIKNEQRRNQEKETLLIQQSKMAKMGDMMGAIVHQWKQPLGVISVTASSAKLDVELGTFTQDGALKSFDNINKQIEVMSQTMDDFGNFFKPTQQKEYQLSKVTIDVYNMLKGIYTSKGIKINYIETSDATVNGYPTELMQVLVNILNNARDIILETKCEQMQVNIEVISDDDYGIIKITDFAGGIPEDIIEKIFKPYFTTKSADKGTGIGLDMSMSIIKKAQGQLSVTNVESTIDDKTYKGASFVIKLPKNKIN